MQQITSIFQNHNSNSSVVKKYRFSTNGPFFQLEFACHMMLTTLVLMAQAQLYTLELEIVAELDVNKWLYILERMSFKESYSRLHDCMQLMQTIH